MKSQTKTSDIQQSDGADCFVPRFGISIPNPRWCLFISASLGFVVWLAMCFAPLDPNYGIGIIEKLFLLSPLVLIPLALAVMLTHLTRVVGRKCPDEGGVSRRAIPEHDALSNHLGAKPSPARTSGWAFAPYNLPCENTLLCVASYLQLFGAMGVAASYFFPRGIASGMFTLPWLVISVLCAFGGVIHLIRGAIRTPTESAFAAALFALPVGAIGFFQSRMGMEPFGFREPLVALVAVHFHYAAIIPLIFAGALGRLRDIATWRDNRIFSATVVLLATGSPMLASGYVFHIPIFRLGGATLLTLGLLSWSVMMLWSLPKVHSRIARLLLAVPALSIIAGMVFAMIYAVADYYGEVWLAIPYMARTHGIINALAFSLCGLVGWCVAFKQLAPQSAAKRIASRELSPLTRRWMI